MGAGLAIPDSPPGVFPQTQNNACEQAPHLRSDVVHRPKTVDALPTLPPLVRAQCSRPVAKLEPVKHARPATSHADRYQPPDSSDARSPPNRPKTHPHRSHKPAYTLSPSLDSATSRLPPMCANPEKNSRACVKPPSSPCSEGNIPPFVNDLWVLLQPRKHAQEFEVIFKTS